MNSLGTTFAIYTTAGILTGLYYSPIINTNVDDQFKNKTNNSANGLYRSFNIGFSICFGLYNGFLSTLGTIALTILLGPQGYTTSFVMNSVLFPNRFKYASDRFNATIRSQEIQHLINQLLQS